MAAADAEAWAADIICSLRGADLAGWTPPWRNPATPPMPPPTAAAAGACGDDGGDARGLVWPAVARGKRSRRGLSPSASGSAASAGAAKKQRNKKERLARGSPASPLDYSAVSGSGSAASTSGGEDGAFCSPPAAAAAAADPDKVGLAGRRSSVLPVPPPRPAGQRPRKKMRLPEIQQMVRSLSVENDALRQEMKALQKACTALSKENGKLETKLDHSSKRRENSSEEENKGKPQPDQRAAEQEARNGFVLPDLNLPVQDMADGSAH